MTIEKTKPGWLGSPQTDISGGNFFDEITELQGTVGIDELKLMANYDGQVSMVLTCFKNPIKSAKWIVEVDGDDSEEAERNKLYVEKYILENPYFNFDQFLDESLSGIEYGNALFEKQYGIVEDSDFGTIPLHVPAFEYREPDSIARWDIDHTGLKGVDQYQYGDTAINKGSAIQYLPSENLMILAFNQKGALYKGKSILTAAYWHWKYKSKFRKINGVGIEKSAIGTPIGTVPPEIKKPTDPNFISFKEILSNFTAHKSSYLIKPSGFDIDYIKIPYDPEKTIAAIRYEDEQISRSVLFGFLELGQGGAGGSYALGADQSDLAMSSIDYIGKKICDKLNREIRQSIFMNFGEPKSGIYPKLKTYQINHKKGKEWATILATLANAGLLSIDEATERRVRSAYELPEKEENAQPIQKPVTKEQDKKDPQDEEVKKNMAEVAPIEQIEDHTFWRELTEYEKGVNFSEINESYDKYNNSIYRTMVNSLNEIAEKTKADVSRLMRKHKGNLQQVVKELKISYASYEKALAAQMSRLAVDAAYTAKRELEKQVTLSSISDIKKDLKFLPKNTSTSLLLQATTQTAKHAAAMEDIVAFEIMAGLDSNLSESQMLYNIEQGLDGFIEGAGVKSANRTIVSQTYNRGRMGFFFIKENLQKIQAFQYSAIVDKRTSDICLSLDKQIFKVEDESSLPYQPPNHYGCRSILVPIGTGEAKPEVTGLTPNPENTSFSTKAIQDARGSKPVTIESIRKSKNL